MSRNSTNKYSTRIPQEKKVIEAAKRSFLEFKNIIAVEIARNLLEDVGKPVIITREYVARKVGMSPYNMNKYVNTEEEVTEL